ncbi:MAG: YicC family protein [Verrucomicrobiales bacterium]|nr:YicC family protein [Verrucomicrobiales bacterium]
MTGYGRGECSSNGLKITVEVSSVNRRQSEISVNLPRELEVLEAQVRDEVNKVVSRGRLTVRIVKHSAAKDGEDKAQINVPLAKAYASEFAKLAKQLKIPGTVTMDVILRAPGVLQAKEEFSEAEEVWPPIEKSLKTALATLVKMREREGSNLAKDLSSRMNIIRKAWQKIEKQAPEAQVRYREQLRLRIKNAGLEMPTIDDERLLKEVVLFADRSDVSEELTRLQSHFQQFEDCLKSKEPVGRTLDFLAQEMKR